MGSSWSPIIEQLDAKRRVTDEVILDNILDVDEEKEVQIVLIKGHAGSGKSITMRRVAWDAWADV